MFLVAVSSGHAGEAQWEVRHETRGRDWGKLSELAGILYVVGVAVFGFSSKKPTDSMIPFSGKEGGRLRLA